VAETCPLPAGRSMVAHILVALGSGLKVKKFSLPTSVQVAQAKKSEKNLRQLPRYRKRGAACKTARQYAPFQNNKRTDDKSRRKCRTNAALDKNLWP
jgi:hypothetical protein